jgi:hypothetical protein
LTRVRRAVYNRGMSNADTLKLTVTKIGSDKESTVTASTAQMLIDHLEASAGRNGFTVDHIERNGNGWILRDGDRVAVWFIHH